MGPVLRGEHGVAEVALRRSPANADAIAGEIRAALRGGGSPAVAQSSQRFFTEPIQTHGWRTADLRRFVRTAQKQILAQGNDALLLRVADRLFTGKINEETHVAVMLVQHRVHHYSDAEFNLFERWLDRVTNWSQHDALVYYLIGPMLIANAKRVRRVFVWARSKDRWHRRAAAVALVHPARQHLYFDDAKRVTQLLLADEDDMVQKGLGWLLREAVKYDPDRTVPYLLTIRDRAPRFILRTACETLSASEKARVLSS
jgi:3-methyladenine DNA glycosylase AlkD